MSGSHILVHGLNSICSRHLTVLLVHVVGARPGVVSDPDTEVLDLQRALLMDLGNSQLVCILQPQSRLPTTFKLTISPFAFLTSRSFIKKYQKRDFATTVFGAKILIRYSFGAGFASDGKWRPMTWYSVRRPNRIVESVIILYTVYQKMIRRSQ